MGLKMLKMPRSKFSIMFGRRNAKQFIYPCIAVMYGISLENASLSLNSTKQWQDYDYDYVARMLAFSLSAKQSTLI